MLTKAIPVTTWITEENLPFDKVFHIRYGRIGFKEQSSQLREVTYEQSDSESAASLGKTEDIQGPPRDRT
jgi:hypothetical protein